MSRPLRVEFEGAVYHITSRGDRKEAIFDDDEDRFQFLDVLSEGLARFDAVVLAWCLMDNHYHLVLCTRRANVSELMRYLNGVYTQRYNHRHDKVGHLFQGRFKGILVQGNAYLAEVCRYVDLNPVRAQVAASPGEWRWSSYRALTGQACAIAGHDAHAVHQLIAPAQSREKAWMAYEQFVSEGVGCKLWEGRGLHGQIFFGDEEFAGKMLARLKDSPAEEVPVPQKYAGRRSLAEYFAADERNRAIWRACLEGGYRQSEIGAFLGLSTSRISRILRTQRKEEFEKG